MWVTKLPFEDGRLLLRPPCVIQGSSTSLCFKQGFLSHHQSDATPRRIDCFTLLLERHLADLWCIIAKSLGTWNRLRDATSKPAVTSVRKVYPGGLFMPLCYTSPDWTIPRFLPIVQCNASCDWMALVMCILSSFSHATWREFPSRGHSHQLLYGVCRPIGSILRDQFP